MELIRQAGLESELFLAGGFVADAANQTTSQVPTLAELLSRRSPDPEQNRERIFARAGYEYWAEGRRGFPVDAADNAANRESPRVVESLDPVHRFCPKGSRLRYS